MQNGKTFPTRKLTVHLHNLFSIFEVRPWCIPNYIMRFRDIRKSANTHTQHNPCSTDKIKN